MALDPALKEKLAQLAPEQRYRYYARRIATKYGIDPDVYEAQVQAESAWNPAAKSEQDARGLAQVLPATAAQYGVTPEQLHDPVIALDTGAKHLRTLLDKYQGDLPTAVLAYHQGEGNVDAGTIGPKGKAYQQKVLGLAEQFKAAAPKVQQAAAPVPAVADTATSDTAPTSDMEQPFVRPEDMSNAAPAAAAPPPSMAKVIAGAPLRAVAGLTDLAAQGGAMLLSGPNSTPQDFGVGSATEAVNSVVPPPATTGQTYADAAAQGATLGIPGGVPGMAIGAAGGVAAQAGADLFAKLGLPPVLGGLIGGGVTGLVTSTGRFAGALKRGIGWERAAEKAAVTELKDATAALEDTRALSAERKAAALEAKNTTVANATDAKRLADTAAKGEAGTTVRQTQREGAASVSAAQQRIDRHAAIRAEVQADAERAVDQFLIQERSPVERARMLQQVTQGRRDAIHSFIGGRYADFLKRADDTGKLVKLAPIRQAAGSLVDDLTEMGLPRDQAAMFGDRIMKIVDREAATFSETQALRSSVGKYAAQAEGPAKARLYVLKDAIDTAMTKAIPENMQAEFTQLRTYRRAEARLFQESYARKALGPDDAGREVATTYLTNLLSGRWTPAKQQSLRDVMLAADEGGRTVLRDALVRQGMQQSSTNGIVDFTQLHRNLMNPEGLRPIAQQLLTGEELRLFQTLSNDMTQATRAYDEAVAAFKPTVGSAREAVRGAKDTAGKAVTAAREQNAATLRGVRSAEARKLLEVRREEAANVATARARLRAAQANVPDPRETVLAQVGSLVMQKPTLMRIIFQPSHRNVLRRAAKVYAGSLKGQEMIRLLVGGAAIGQEQAGPSAPTRVEAPSAPGMP